MGSASSVTPPLDLRTERMLLVACDLARFDAMLEGEAALSRVLGLPAAENWTGGFDVEAVATRLRVGLASDPARLAWWARLFLHQDDHCLIGFGGYKGPPNADGVVEIGYALAPSYRGVGLATEAASAMARTALASSGVACVRAHTLPEDNASTAVLRRVGMRLDGPAREGGREVWRWSCGRGDLGGA